MRIAEFIIALFIAVAVFITLKVLGLLIKFAAIAAVIGFVAGLLLARGFRKAG